MNGVALLEANKPLRHSSIQMTERYAHLKPEAPRDAVNALDRLQSHLVTVAVRLTQAVTS